jgi:hypothetical protein
MFEIHMAKIGIPMYSVHFQMSVFVIHVPEKLRGAVVVVLTFFLLKVVQLML